MFWEEDEDKSLPYEVSDDIIDLNFTIRSKSLPIDHAWTLSEAIIQHLPWIKTHPTAGIHQIHVAESNNGWMRPENDEKDALLYPSRRSKLTLRIPKDKVSVSQEKLTDKTLEIGEHQLIIGHSKVQLLTNSGVIFSRYVPTFDGETENDFLSRSAKEIKAKTDFTVKKMLCGKSHSIHTPNGRLFTKHLMIADLDNDTSIKLQQLGLGDQKHLGCGLFLPHKGIKSLNATE